MYSFIISYSTYGKVKFKYSKKEPSVLNIHKQQITYQYFFIFKLINSSINFNKDISNNITIVAMWTCRHIRFSLFMAERSQKKYYVVLANCRIHMRICLCVVKLKLIKKTFFYYYFFLSYICSDHWTFILREKNLYKTRDETKIVRLLFICLKKKKKKTFNIDN
jgi:hypothetical protein